MKTIFIFILALYLNANTVVAQSDVHKLLDDPQISLAANVVQKPAGAPPRRGSLAP